MKRWITFFAVLLLSLPVFADGPTQPALRPSLNLNDVQSKALSRANLAVLPSATSIVLHPDGTSTAFNAASNTDAARGAAILTAIADSSTVAGSVIILGPGEFDTLSQIDLSTSSKNLSLIGQGKGVTKIVGNFSSAPVVMFGNNSLVANMSINTINTTQAQLGKLSGGATGAIFMNLSMTGFTDGFYVPSTTQCTGTFYNVDISTNFDTFFVSGNAHRFDVYNSNFIVVGPNSQDGNTSRALIGGSGSRVRMYGGSLTVINGGNTANIAAAAVNNMTIELHEVSITTSNTGSAPPLDLSQSGSGVMSVSSSVVYNPAKTSGTITPLNYSNPLLNGHVATTGTAASLGSCGTSPTITGNDIRGVITVGTGIVTTCQLNFAASYATTPVCTVAFSSLTVPVFISSISTSNVVFGSSSLTSVTIYYNCIQ